MGPRAGPRKCRALGAQARRSRVGSLPGGAESFGGAPVRKLCEGGVSEHRYVLAAGSPTPKSRIPDRSARRKRVLADCRAHGQGVPARGPYNTPRMAKGWGGDRGWWGDAGGVTMSFSGPTAGVTPGWERTQKGGGARCDSIACRGGGPPGLTARRVARDRPVLAADVVCRRFPRCNGKRDRPNGPWPPKAGPYARRSDGVRSRPCPRRAYFPRVSGG